MFSYVAAGINIVIIQSSNSVVVDHGDPFGGRLAYGGFDSMFPDEFWFELARLEGIHYSPRSRPLRWGKYVMAFVYDAVDGDIGKKLREINPAPRFQQNHHQWLKDFGRQKVHDQIERVITIMKLCKNMDEFRDKFAYVFQKSPIQTT